MEKQIQNTDTSTLERALYQDPDANFRVKIENSKRQLEKIRTEGINRPIHSERKMIGYLKSSQ